jgi:hypothetical protein
MDKYSLKEMLSRYALPVIPLILLVFSIIERNIIAAILSVMLYFVIYISEILLRIHEDNQVNQSIMIEILDFDANYDEYDSEDEEDYEDEQDVIDEINNQSPKLKRVRNNLDDTDDATWTALLKKLKGEEGK